MSTDTLQQYNQTLTQVVAEFNAEHHTAIALDCNYPRLMLNVETIPTELSRIFYQTLQEAGIIKGELIKVKFVGCDHFGTKTYRSAKGNFFKLVDGHLFTVTNEQEPNLPCHEGVVIGEFA